MMRSALNAIDAHSETTAMIGDRMDTDIVAGLEAGLETILVLTGRQHARGGRALPVPRRRGSSTRSRTSPTSWSRASTTPAVVAPGVSGSRRRREYSAVMTARHRAALAAAAALAAVALVLTRRARSSCPNLEHALTDLADTLGAWTYALVGGLAFLETGAFVGLIAPGETAIVLGGVVAAQGEVDLVAGRC